MPINGTSGDDYLAGTGGDDELNGLAGNDFLDGLAGADIMDGGIGNDIFVVDNEGDVIRELLGEGGDLVFARISYALTAGAHVEALSTVQHSATTAINLAGNALAQTLYGNYGANVLDGRGGADVLVGMFGNDVYRVYSQADQVVEAAGQGDDIVFTSASYTLGAGVEVETLSTDFHAGTAAINLIGNALNNTLIGNYGANVLNGGGGSAGDTLYGLAGNDIYVVQNGFDKVFEAAGHGGDLVYTSFSYALLAGQEVETLSTSVHAGTAAIHLTGNTLSNTLIGNYGFNILTGLGGGDLMMGLKGNDTYNVHDSRDIIVEAVGDGYDQVEVYTSYTLGAGQEIESLRIALFGAYDAFVLRGNEFGQFIGGSAGRNLLDGGLGNDVLNGGARADVFAFTTAPGPDNVDQIDFFEISEDEILLSSAIFTGIGNGRVALSRIAYGPAATTADHRIVLDPTTGGLYYDADGNGAGAALQFARLSPGERVIADLKIYVEGPNHAPVANPDQDQVHKGQGQGITGGNVLTNDTDADGHALFIASVQGGSVPIGQPVIGTYGRFTLLLEGSWSYALDRTDPDTLALGHGMTGIDTFAYEVSDGRGGSSTSTVAVTIIGGSLPYTATVDSPQAVEGDTGTTVPMVFTLRLDRPAEAAFTVFYQTQLAIGSDGSNLPGSTDDFVHASVQFQFAAGQQEAVISIGVVGDELVEGNEYFAVIFASSVFVNSLYSIATIIDDETAGQAPAAASGWTGADMFDTSASGGLSYDADGNGAGAAVQFATLGTGLALAASELFVIAG